MSTPEPTFEEDVPRDDAEALVLDIEGYEGPLDLLLDLARRQKVDLTKISILSLADQYLAFIDRARTLRIEVAADYLVMASWLAYLKSRLILPRTADAPGEDPGDLATRLALRLQRLNQIREASQKLVGRHRLGIDVFACGQPSQIKDQKTKVWDADLIELLQAYAQRRQKAVAGQMTVGHRIVWSLVDAKEAIEGILGELVDWAPIEPYLEQFVARVDAPAQKARATVKASALSAMLEMAREGVLDLKQDSLFGPITIRRRDAPLP